MLEGINLVVSGDITPAEAKGTYHPDGLWNGQMSYRLGVSIWTIAYDGGVGLDICQDKEAFDTYWAKSFPGYTGNYNPVLGTGIAYVAWG